MGVDTKLYLPPEARIEDVFDVLTIMLGGDVYKHDFTATNHGGWSAEVRPVPEYKTFNDIPTMVVANGDVNGAIYHVYYHFEGGFLPGWKQLSTGYRTERKPLWIAMTDFFGGMLDMSDSDDIEIDHAGIWSEKRGYRLDGSDGDAWYQFQEAKLNVKQVLTADEWNH